MKLIKVSDDVHRRLMDLKTKMNMRSLSQVIEFLVDHYNPENIPLLQLLRQISMQLSTIKGNIDYVLDIVREEGITTTRQEVYQVDQETDKSKPRDYCW